MKKVLGSMTEIIFAVFCVAILGLLMSFTLGALRKLFPDSFVNQMWGLVLFDIAAMVWGLAFVFKSQSTGQYAAAGIGFGPTCVIRNPGRREDIQWTVSGERSIQRAMPRAGRLDAPGVLHHIMIRGIKR